MARPAVLASAVMWLCSIMFCSAVFDSAASTLEQSHHLAVLAASYTAILYQRCSPWRALVH